MRFLDKGKEERKVSTVTIQVYVNFICRMKEWVKRKKLKKESNGIYVSPIRCMLVCSLAF